MTFAAHSDGSQGTGFSLVEMVIAVSILLGVGGAILHLFVQNERLVRDESIALEMRQSVRAVASLIADELYLGGMGVPVFAARQGQVGNEAVQTFLAGTDPARVRMRINPGPLDSALQDIAPMLFETGVERAIAPDPAFRPSVGGHLFLWGQTAGSWTWVRARTETWIGRATLAVVPVQVSSEGGLLTSRVRVAEEDAVSYRLSGRSVLRGELSDMSNLADPRFRELSVGDHFTTLEFVYYDGIGQIVDTTSAAGREAVRRVDFLLEAETAEALSDGLARRHAITMSVSPRNLGL